MKQANILYVEDEAVLAQVIIDALEDRNFKVKWTNDGSAAFNLFKSSTYDICLVDIMVPKMDGLSLVKKIRGINTIVPILFLSARTLTDDVVRGFEVGGNDYLKKPFAIEELVVRIQALLQRRTVTSDTLRSAQFELEKIGNYECDFNKMELRFDQTRIKLTHTENEILKALLAKRNQIVERNEILNAIWGNNDSYNARSMDVFISKLRKYLAFDPDIEIINIRGVGFRMRVND